MSDKTLNRIAKVSAMQNDMCEKWHNLWNDEWSEGDLIDNYKKATDFAIKNDWPSKEFIKEHFDDALLKSRHVYVGTEVKDGNFSDVATIVQSGSVGELHFCGYNTTTVWVRHDSELLITASGNSFVFVHVYDNAHVTVEQSGCARVTVKRHSADASVITKGIMKYIDPYA